MKLNYYYGTMASGKSATLLMNVYQKEENDTSCLLLKPSEKRDKNFIKSRVGLQKKCITFDAQTDIFELIYNYWQEFAIEEVYIDECQFLEKKQIEQLWDITRMLAIKINCFGLKTTYKNELFEGIKTLMVYADNIIELEPKSRCKYCKEDATTHMLLIDNKVVLDLPEKFEGDIVGSTRFESVCQKCYKEKIKNII